MRKGYSPVTRLSYAVTLAPPARVVSCTRPRLVSASSSEAGPGVLPSGEQVRRCFARVSSVDLLRPGEQVRTCFARVSSVDLLRTGEQCGPASYG